MTSTANVAAYRVQRDLINFENALDAALVAQFQLGQSMISGRRAFDLPVVAGHVALMNLTKAAQSLVTARTAAIRAHEDLFKVGEENGSVLTGPKPPGGMNRFEAEISSVERKDAA